MKNINYLKQIVASLLIFNGSISLAGPINSYAIETMTKAFGRLNVEKEAAIKNITSGDSLGVPVLNYSHPAYDNQQVIVKSRQYFNTVNEIQRTGTIVESTRGGSLDIGVDMPSWAWGNYGSNGVVGTIDLRLGRKSFRERPVNFVVRIGIAEADDVEKRRLIKGVNQITKEAGLAKYTGKPLPFNPGGELASVKIYIPSEISESKLKKLLTDLADLISEDPVLF